MNTGPPVGQHARLAGQLGHQIFVDVVGTVEIPDKNGDDGVGRDQDCHQNQRQPPDLDVVGQEHDDRETCNQHQPAAGIVDAFRIVDGGWRLHTQKLGKLALGLQAFLDQARPVTGDLVDQADGLDLDDIGDGDGGRHQHKCQIHEQAKSASPDRRLGPASPHRMFERDDCHHQREKGGIKPFKGEFAEGHSLHACQRRRKIVIAGNTRRHIDQSDDDHRHRQPIDKLQAKILVGWRFLTDVGHALVPR